MINISTKLNIPLHITDTIKTLLGNILDFDVDIKIEKHRKRRSFEANAYFHVLADKLAEKLEQTNHFIKNDMINKYGQREYIDDKLVTFIIPDSADVSEKQDIHLCQTSKTRVMDDGRLYRVYIVMRGSSTYNTAEMSRLIEGTIYECRQAKMTEDEIASPRNRQMLEERYGVHFEETNKSPAV